MRTECNTKKYEFQGLNRRKVEASFSGGAITTDSGGILLREVEKKFQIIEKFSKCFTDYRRAGLIEHTMYELVSQRIYGLALGYEDLKDHDDLRNDPLFGILVDKKEPEGCCC